jgi:hypothetical protein
LLPWADPYISSLVQRLKESHDAEWTEFANPRGVDFDPPTAEWEDDAFMPRREELSWAREERPVFGGFPLLDDAE